jgi:hypothetical protein
MPFSPPLASDCAAYRSNSIELIMRDYQAINPSIYTNKNPARFGVQQIKY